ncbi:MAG: hypothetical protein AMXMBFR84_40900 [Candidatus Hydrogenedentota bacterium]
MKIEPSDLWIQSLTEEERQFLKRFLLASGSLKSLAEDYGVSYPTLRSRLDRLIAKVKHLDTPGDVDPFGRLLEVLIAEGVLLATTARTLEQAHKRSLMETRSPDRL